MMISPKPVLHENNTLPFPRIRRHAPFDISGFTFAAAERPEQKQEAYSCRARAYRKYFSRLEDGIDTFDERARLYLCRENRTGAVVGSMRSVSSQTGPLELETWFDLAANRDRGHVLGEASRFGVPPHPQAFFIKLGLWKLLYLDLLASGHTHMIAWVRAGARPGYLDLLFEDYPAPVHVFHHPRLRGRLHHVLIQEIASIPARFRAAGHPLHDFFCVRRDPNILLGRPEKAEAGR